jgi:hypothetical protein
MWGVQKLNLEGINQLALSVNQHTCSLLVVNKEGFFEFVEGFFIEVRIF